MERGQYSTLLAREDSRLASLVNTYNREAKDLVQQGADVALAAEADAADAALRRRRASSAGTAGSADVEDVDIGSIPRDRQSSLASSRGRSGSVAVAKAIKAQKYALHARHSIARWWSCHNCNTLVSLCQVRGQAGGGREACQGWRRPQGVWHLRYRSWRLLPRVGGADWFCHLPCMCDTRSALALGTVVPHHVVVVVVVVAAVMLPQLFMVLSDYWLSVWSSTSDESTTSAQHMGYLGIYALFVLGTLIAIGVKGVLQALAAIRASRALHAGLVNSVLSLPMSFFDTTPLGRVLNRYGVCPPCVVATRSLLTVPHAMLCCAACAQV